MKTLMIHETEICSLADLREHFDLPQVTAAFLNGALETWLKDCYYDREAQAVGALEHTLSPAVEGELCRVLGVNFPKQSPEQREKWERKLAAIQQVTQNPTVFTHVMETATNQRELAELLDEGKETIYLCTGAFTVPIRKGGVHYIGVGNPRMEAPFTQEQYRRAGITFEGVRLPQETDEESSRIAEQAAAEYGYDNFAEKHSPLAALLHAGIKGSSITRFLRLEHNAFDVGSKFYHSRSEAERIAHRAINQVYDQANEYFSPGQSRCLADVLAERYGERIQKGAKRLVSLLEPLSGRSPYWKERIAALNQKVDRAQEGLQKQFERELWDSSDYYQMYQRSYFLEQIDIEDHDYNVDIFENDLLNGLCRLIHDETEYSVEGLFDAVSELEEDVRKHADTFFGCAYQLYQKYCSEMEEIAEEIGRELTDDDLVKLGILPRKTEIRGKT